MRTFARPPTLRRQLAVLFALACAPLGACARGGVDEPGAPPAGVTCTEIGCLSGLRIELTPGAPMPAGAYVFDLEVDGAAVRCEGALPLAPCDQGPSVRCAPDTGVVIETSGCAMPAAEQGFSGILFDGARPTHVTVAIQRDGASIATADLHPEYRTLQPNGPACPPTCEQASASVAITEPAS